MTPTEQANELREAIIGIVEAEYKMPNHIPAIQRVEHIMQLITADRKRVALEARIDELKQLTEFRVATIGIIHGRHHRSYCDRIAELKAQQGV